MTHGRSASRAGPSTRPWHGPSWTPRATADRLLAQQRDRIVTTAEALYRQFDNDASRRLQGRPELGPTMAGESCCLRAIIHTVIKEMAARLAV
mgnify:FL=1